MDTCSNLPALSQKIVIPSPQTIPSSPSSDCWDKPLIPRTIDTTPETAFEARNTQVMEQDNTGKSNVPVPNTLYIATDGSFDQQNGTFAWTSYCNGQYKTHADSVPGNPTGTSARRCEAFSILAALRYVIRHVVIISPTIQTVNIYTDHRNLWKSIKQRFLHPLTDDYDVISQIRHDMTTIQQSIPAVLHHIQPKKPAETNDFRHSLHRSSHNAGNECLTLRPTPVPNILCPAVKFCLMRNGQIITSNIKTLLRYDYHNTRYATYIKSKHSWTESTYSSIDWCHLGKALQQFPSNDRIVICKLRHNWSPTNDRLHRLHVTHKPTCPFCECTETLVHVYCCESPEHTARRQLSIEKLRDALLGASLLSTEIEIVVNFVCGNYHQYTATPEEHSPTLDQRLIGNHLFRMGFIPKSWFESIKYQTKEKSDSTRRIKIIRSILRCSVELWKMRCIFYHTAPDRERAQKISEIQEFFTEFPYIPQEYNFLTRNPVDKLIQKPTSQLSIWLTHATAVREPLRDAIRKANKNLITRYFQAVPRNNPATTPTRHVSVQSLPRTALPVELPAARNRIATLSKPVSRKQKSPSASQKIPFASRTHQTRQTISTSKHQKRIPPTTSATLAPLPRTPDTSKTFPSDKPTDDTSTREPDQDGLTKTSFLDFSV